MYAFFGFSSTPPSHNKAADQRRQSQAEVHMSPSQLSGVQSPSSYGSLDAPDSPGFADSHVPHVGSNLSLTTAEEKEKEEEEEEEEC